MRALWLVACVPFACAAVGVACRSFDDAAPSTSYRAGTNARIFRARASGQGFGDAIRVDGIATPTTAAESYPTLSPDESLLVFMRLDVPNNQLEIWGARKDGSNGGYGGIFQLPGINQGNANTVTPFLVASGREIFVGRAPQGGEQNIFRATIDDDGGIGAPTIVPELQTPQKETAPVLSFDGLTIFYGSARTDDNAGGLDIWTAHRPAVGQPFTPPHAVKGLATKDDEQPSFLSRDQCRLYFSSDRSGKHQIYVASRK